MTMGYGSYSAEDWSKLRTSRKLETTNSVTETFVKQSCDPKYDPRYIGTRECFDSEDHPNSTPIVVGLDVTGSMGYLAVKVASEALNELIMKLYSTDAVEDPALMCAAYGDYMDDAPLQVTQFESDIRIVEQLLDLHFENGGQGYVVPHYLWDFLTNRTNIDAINKRQQKGFVFTIGDGADIRRVAPHPEEALRAVEKKFHVFHIMIVGQGMYDGPSKHNERLLNGRTMNIRQTDIDLIPQMIISAIQLQKGAALDTVLAQWDEMERPRLGNILGQLQLCGGEQVFL